MQNRHSALLCSVAYKNENMLYVANYFYRWSPTIMQINYHIKQSVELKNSTKTTSPTCPPPFPQKTTRTVCNQPLRNLLKNNSKAKITKKTNPTNSLHI